MQPIHYLRDSITTGFIDVLHQSSEAYRPQLLLNDKLRQKKVLTSLTKEIKECESFWISVAFLTTSGVASIISALEEFRDMGKRGKILVSDYLGFTQPEAMARLLQFSNIELKISQNRSFHAKGYLFLYSGIYNLIVGSSNLTASALSTNTEWNLKVSASIESEIVSRALDEFGREFDGAVEVDEEFLEQYREYYRGFESTRVAMATDAGLFTSRIEPNKMQVEALANINELRLAGNNKALLISATGTGKTFLSAFDVLNSGSKTMLFIVHRTNIAEAARQTYLKIFGDRYSMGLYSGQSREGQHDFVFCTIQTMSRAEHYQQFAPDHFDYIVVDETHRAAAHSYDGVLGYFKPKFLLGMTATPERTDGVDIFKLFDHNIAYEIRLNKALEEEMLVPFHYYGITDLSVDGEIIDNAAQFNQLVAVERVSHIIEKARFYGTDSGVIRGLVFCSSTDESQTLARKFEEFGYKTVALSSTSTEGQRTAAIQKLESCDIDDKLDYIFTVDIFNEGIDIPAVNQVILLRPTESAIVYIQQLGRGLRKTLGKSYLTVLDFIGNYQNNFIIPIALYGDKSYNKESLRRLLSAGSEFLPGSSTVDFDQISKERIFSSIQNSNFRLRKDLFKDYNLLKFQLGRSPFMIDFLNHDSRDPFTFVLYSKSYYNFLLLVEPELEVLDKKTQTLLQSIAIEVNNGKRVQDSVVLKELLVGNNVDNQILNRLLEEVGVSGTRVADLQSIRKNLNLEFVTVRSGDKNVTIKEANDIDFVRIENGTLVPGPDMLKLVSNPLAKDSLLDNSEFSIQTFKRQLLSEKFVDGFVLYNRYSRKDALRILDWPVNPVGLNVGGYVYDIAKQAFAIFVTYHKSDDISNTTKYADRFLNRNEFQWMSKSNRTLNSPEIQVLKSNINMRICLFVKKENKKEEEHYYLGDIVPDGESFAQTYMPGDEGASIPVVSIKFKLERPVREELYDYITGVSA
ncbi:MAG: DUF3427 domain-containing protein [Chitinophagaceae bacterium]|nr:MAG: DUF3427 domain-containing protein [Chitinophagaceae bacterium]